ncbi:MAG: hypothetical protein ACLPX7_24145 [Xanthobacteraceae bacterium]
MNWRLAPTIGLVAVLAPAMAHAQTNLDQGKSASQIFAAACAECHKAPRGLAKGRNSAALTDFLREHYTTSRDQAAALAAYVQGGRGTEPVGGTAQGKSQKPAAERAERGSPSVEEPREPKPTKRQARQSKPEEATRTEAKSDAKPEVKPDIELTPGERPPTAATRGRRKEPRTPQSPVEPAGVARAPAAVAVEPAQSMPPSPEASPAATPAATPEPSAPGDAASGENGPVPRDNIPD